MAIRFIGVGEYSSSTPMALLRFRRRSSGFGLDPHELFFLFFPVFETTGGDYFVAGLGEYVRGTRGSASAVSSSDDGSVPGDFLHALFQLAERNVDVALERAEFFDFLRFTNIEKEHVLLVLEELCEVIGIGDFSDFRLLGGILRKSHCDDGQHEGEPFHDLSVANRYDGVSRIWPL